VPIFRRDYSCGFSTVEFEWIPVCCAGTDEPAGNAVKDSMLAKVGPETRKVLAVVYGATKLDDDGLLEGAARELQTLLAEFAFAQNCVWSISPG
jgi:hypothetical protein